MTWGMRRHCGGAKTRRGAGLARRWGWRDRPTQPRHCPAPPHPPPPACSGSAAAHRAASQFFGTSHSAALLYSWGRPVMGYPRTPPSSSVVHPLMKNKIQVIHHHFLDKQGEGLRRSRVKRVKSIYIFTMQYFQSDINMLPRQCCT